MTDKRSRGRPRGTGANDIPHLAKIADIMIADKLTKPTTAMRRHLAAASIKWPVRDDTVIRRWQVKWKEHGEELLEAARKRAEPVRRSVPRTLPLSRLEELALGNLSGPITQAVELLSDKRWPHKLQTSSLIDVMEKARQQQAFLDHAFATQKAVKAALGQDYRSTLLEVSQRVDLLKRAGVLK